MTGIEANMARNLGLLVGDRFHVFLLEVFLIILCSGVSPMLCLGQIDRFQPVP
jgi:hypothetical protein